jgi:acetoin utilization protein AcuB
MITNSDLLNMFMHITGANEPSSHIELKLEKHGKSLYGALRILEQMHIGFSNVLMYKGIHQDCNRLVIRSNTMKTDRLAAELRKEGYEVLWPQEKQ